MIVIVFGISLFFHIFRVMNIFEFGRLSSDNIELIKYLRSKGLLSSHSWCTKCNKRWRSQVKDKEVKDGYRWKCPDKQCGSKEFLRQGSFFVNKKWSKFPLRVLFAIIWFFSNDVSQTHIIRQIGEFITDESVGQWQQYLRDVCSTWLLANPILIGGPGQINTVQIDESKLGKKRKYHRGRCGPAKDKDWLIGVWSPRSKQGCMRIVQNRNQITCIKFIKDFVKKGTIIHSDCWKGYFNVKKAGYFHQTVNHSKNFVDPKTKAHTQAIEGLWTQIKSRIKRCRGYPKHLRPTYTDEALYRLNRVPGRSPYASLYTELIADIATQYPFSPAPSCAPEPPQPRF